MKTIRKPLGIICLISILLVSLPAVRTEGSEEGNKGTALVRFGYSQSADYGSFCQVLLQIAREYVAEGSLDPSLAEKYKGVNFEEEFERGDARRLWNDICDANVEGAKYVFVREAFFDMGEMEEDEYESMINRDDIDIIFSMGTRSGVYLAENETKNKFMNMYSSDPVESHIVKSETERYNKNAFATIDNTPYIRQLDTGYKFLGFKKLGVVYEDSEDAYLYSAIGVVEQKAEEYGFEVVYEYVTEPVSDDEFDRYYEELRQAYRRLADQGIDCLYVTLAQIEYEDKMQELLDDCIIPRGIMSLAQDDFLPVEYGVLFGVTINDCAETANHVVKQIKLYAEEEVPFDELDMICETTPKIGVNYTTANRIGFELSFENLQLVDRVYR